MRVVTEYTEPRGQTASGLAGPKCLPDWGQREGACHHRSEYAKSPALVDRITINASVVLFPYRIVCAALAASFTVKAARFAVFE